MTKINQDVIRKIEFATRYHWEVLLKKFPNGADSQFDLLKSSMDSGGVVSPDSVFLLARSIEFTRANILSKEFEFYGLKIPLASQIGGVQMVLYDIKNYPLLRFFDNWMNNEIGGGRVGDNNHQVGTINNISRIMEIRKFLPNDHDNPIDTKILYVYPEGELVDSLDYEASEAYTFNVNLVVVGEG